MRMSQSPAHVTNIRSAVVLCASWGGWHVHLRSLSEVEDADQEDQCLFAL